MKYLLLGLNRSGTSALAYRVFAAVNGRKSMSFEPRRQGGAEDVQFHTNACAKTHSVVTKCLIYPTNHTDWQAIFTNADRYDRALWVSRDPRDILISSFFYHWYKGHGAPDNVYRLALERVQAKEQRPTTLSFTELVSGTLSPDRSALRNWQQSWYDHLNHRFDELRQHLDIVYYEDMVSGNLDSLNKLTELDLSEEATLPEHRQRVARSRTTANWRYWFTEEDVAFFKPVFNTYLANAGYNADDWELRPVNRIASAEASEYMNRIRLQSPVKKIMGGVKQLTSNLYHAYKPG